MAPNGGFAAPGTRIGGQLTTQSQLWLYIQQAIAVSIALDVFLAILLLWYVIIGWWFSMIVLGFLGWAIGAVLLVFGRPQKRFWYLLFGYLWTIGTLAPLWPVIGEDWAMVAGLYWHSTLTDGIALIGAQLTVVTLVPWWAWAIATALLLAVALRGKWRLSLVLLALLPIVCIIALSDWAEWAQAWDNLRWLLVLFSGPVMPCALLLAAVLVKEMLLPNLEWTLKPIAFEELRGIGLRALWLPSLFPGSDAPPAEVGERRVRVEEREEQENGTVKEKYTYLSDSDQARDFYRALSKRADFTLSTGIKCGLSRKEFTRIRDIFIDRGWAEWRNERFHAQGVELTTKGEQRIEDLILGDPRT